MAAPAIIDITTVYRVFMLALPNRPPNTSVRGIGRNRGATLEIHEIKLGATGGRGGTAQTAPAHQGTEHQGRNDRLKQPEQTITCAILHEHDSSLCRIS